jgi:threonine/homoserine efflux transporter RhtA
VVLASLFGILLWQEMLSLDSWLAVALIIGSGIMSVIANAQSQTKN